MKKTYALVAVGIVLALFALSRLYVPTPVRPTNAALKTKAANVLKTLYAAAHVQPFEADLGRQGLAERDFPGVAYGYPPKCEATLRTNSVRMGSPLPEDLTLADFEKALNTLRCPDAKNGLFAVGVIYRNLEKQLTMQWIDEGKEIREAKF